MPGMTIRQAARLITCLASFLYRGKRQKSVDIIKLVNYCLNNLNRLLAEAKNGIIFLQRLSTS